MVSAGLTASAGIHCAKPQAIKSGINVLIGSQISPTLLVHIKSSSSSSKILSIVLVMRRSHG